MLGGADYWLVRRILSERLLLVSSVLLGPASLRSRRGSCELLRSVYGQLELRAYLCFDVVQILLARVEVVLVLAAVEAAVAAGVTQKPLTTSG